MAAEPEDHPDIQVFDEIRYIEHLVRTAIARKLPVGLTYPQFEVMNLLSRRGDGITPLAIARALQMTKSGLTNTLQRLHARKLIRRRALPERRAQEAHLADRARAGRPTASAMVAHPARGWTACATASPRRNSATPCRS